MERDNVDVYRQLIVQFRSILSSFCRYNGGRCTRPRPGRVRPPSESHPNDKREAGRLQQTSKQTPPIATLVASSSQTEHPHRRRSDRRQPERRDVIARPDPLGERRVIRAVRMRHPERSRRVHVSR